MNPLEKDPSNIISTKNFELYIFFTIFVKNILVVERNINIIMELFNSYLLCRITLKRGQIERLI